MHYCGSQLQSVSISIFEADNGMNCLCDNAISVKHNGCCSEKSIHPQVSKDRQLITNDYSNYLKLPFQTIAISRFQHIDLFSKNQTPLSFYSNTPPNLWRKVPLYKLLRRFTYYG